MRDRGPVSVDQQVSSAVRRNGPGERARSVKGRQQNTGVGGDPERLAREQCGGRRWVTRVVARCARRRSSMLPQRGLLSYHSLRCPRVGGAIGQSRTPALTPRGDPVSAYGGWMASKPSRMNASDGMAFDASKSIASNSSNARSLMHQ